VSARTASACLRQDECSSPDWTSAVSGLRAVHDCAAAAVMALLGTTSDQITSCSLIKGDSNMGWGNRSVTRADVN
jgi:hypothetical protein